MSEKYFYDNMFDTMLGMAAHEMLEQDLAELSSGNVVKHEFSPEFERKMKKLITVRIKSSRQKRTLKALRTFAAVLVILMAVGFIGVMSFAATRNAVINAFIEIGENFFGFRFGNENIDLDSPDILRPSYLPQGYREDSTYPINNGVGIKYVSDDNRKLYFDQFPKEDGVTVQIDSEHSVPYEVDVNGVTLTVFDGTPEGYACYVVWEGESTFYTIMAEVPTDELVAMARSVIEIGIK